MVNHSTTRFRASLHSPAPRQRLLRGTRTGTQAPSPSHGREMGRGRQESSFGRKSTLCPPPMRPGRHTLRRGHPIPNGRRQAPSPAGHAWIVRQLEHRAVPIILLAREGFPLLVGLVHPGAQLVDRELPPVQPTALLPRDSPSARQRPLDDRQSLETAASLPNHSSRNRSLLCQRPRRRLPHATSSTAYRVIEEIRRAFAAGRVRWRQHALERMLVRGSARSCVGGRRQWPCHRRVHFRSTLSSLSCSRGNARTSATCRDRIQ